VSTSEGVGFENVHVYDVPGELFSGDVFGSIFDSKKSSRDATFVLSVVYFPMVKLNILTYNIRGDLWNPECTDEFTALVHKHEVDVICLQEVVRTFNQGQRSEEDANILQELKRSLAEEFDTVEYLPVQASDKSIGNAILFRHDGLCSIGQNYGKAFPKRSSRALPEEWADKFLVPMRRVIMSEKFTMDHKKLIVYNVHLDYFGGDTRRISQIQHFFNLWGGEREGENIIEIIAGDFNTWLPYKLMKLYRRISILARFLTKKGFIEASRHIPWTQIFDRSEADSSSQKGIRQTNALERFVGKFDRSFKQKLDHIWIRGDAEVISCERLDVALSDHYPVLLKLRLTGEKEDADD